MWPFRKKKDFSDTVSISSVTAPKSMKSELKSNPMVIAERPKVCETCGCVIGERCEQPVFHTDAMSYSSNDRKRFYQPIAYYCKVCKPPYDFSSEEFLSNKSVYYKHVPSKKVRVNKDGTSYKEPKRKKK